MINDGLRGLGALMSMAGNCNHDQPMPSARVESMILQLQDVSKTINKDHNLQPGDIVRFMSWCNRNIHQVRPGQPMLVLRVLTAEDKAEIGFYAEDHSMIATLTEVEVLVMDDDDRQVSMHVVDARTLEPYPK